MKPSFLAILCAGLSAACGAQILDVGSTDKNAPSQAGGPATKDDGSWFPASACVPVGATPKILVQQPSLSTRLLVPDGETLWFAGEDTTDTTQTVNRVYRVATAGGAPTSIDLDGYTGGSFGWWDGNIAYVKTLHAGSASEADPKREAIVVLDRATGATTTIPNPGQSTYVSNVRLHPTGIYWLSREYRADRPLSISRWTPSGAVELTSMENFSQTVTDGREVFYVRWAKQEGGSIEIRVEAVPVAGGAPRVLRRLPYDRESFTSLIAVDNVELFFSIQRTTNGGTIQDGDILAIPKDATEGAVERVVTAGQYISYGTLMDPEYLTWIDQNAQSELVRVPRAGGALERIPAAGANRYVQAIAADRCNLYWSVVNPPAIYARSRLTP